MRVQSSKDDWTYWLGNTTNRFALPWQRNHLSLGKLHVTNIQLSLSVCVGRQLQSIILVLALGAIGRPMSSAETEKYGSTCLLENTPESGTSGTTSAYNMTPGTGTPAPKSPQVYDRSGRTYAHLTLTHKPVTRRGAGRLDLAGNFFVPSVKTL